MSKVMETLKRWSSDHSRYRLAVDKAGFRVEKYYDPYRNGFPRWTPISTPESVVLQLVKASKQFSLPLDKDGAMIFNYELGALRKTLLQEHEDFTVATRQKAFIQQYDNI